MIVGGSDPQAQDIGAVLVGNILGDHAVAQRFRHLFALAVHNPAVGADLAVGRGVAPGHRRE
ncbi:hypothetical protein DSECCO2_652270 [anaerobic digester metagenome]